MTARGSGGKVTYPHDPLASVVDGNEYRRSLVSGVLESYNSNYDFLGEAVQNAVDAIEDAKLRGLQWSFPPRRYHQSKRKLGIGARYRRRDDRT